MTKPARQGASSDPVSPTYPEAYPRISVGGWLREAADGRAYLLWRDQDDLIAGVAALKYHDPVSITFVYRICDLVYEEEGEGEQTLQLSWKGSRDDNRRPYAACPRCQRMAETIVMAGSAWACMACHRLTNRSAKLRQEIRWSEEIALLEQRLDASLILSTSRQRRAVLESRRSALLTKLGSWRPQANKNYRVILRPEYVAMVDVAPCSLG